MKDVLDIYVISFITEIDVDELHQIWVDTDRKLGDFRSYKAQFVELKEAYDKMKGVKNKPDFYEVYHRVSNVVVNLNFKKKRKFLIRRIRIISANLKAGEESLAFIYEAI